MQKFNLLDENWIECVDISGTFREVGIREILLNAHLFKKLASPIPLVNASILFLLETIITRALFVGDFACDDYSEWYEGFKKKQFSPAFFEKYFQQWSDRFYLFNDKRPFMQEIIDGDNYTGTAMKLLPHFSGGTGGNSATLFDHHTLQEGIALTIKDAARFLLPAHYYGAGGRIIGSDYFNDSPISSGLAFFVVGNNLFETLFLNLLSYPDIQGLVIKNGDVPIWERNHQDPTRNVHIEEGKKTYQPLGFMDLMTWNGRKIQLLLDEDNKIRQIKMRSGVKMTDQVFPWFAYNQKGNYLRARREHAVWRDFVLLLQFKETISGDDTYNAPLPIQWLHELAEAGFYEKDTFSIMGLGMAKEAGKQNVYFYTEQFLPFPSDYLVNHDLSIDVSTALNYADTISKSLYWAMSLFAETILSFNVDQVNGRKPDPNDKKKLVEHLGADRFFWGSLETGFHNLIHQLPQDREAAILFWKTLIRDNARNALEHGIRMAGDSINALKASVSARSILENAIRKNIGDVEKETIHE